MNISVQRRRILNCNEEIQSYSVKCWSIPTSSVTSDQRDQGQGSNSAIMLALMPNSYLVFNIQGFFFLIWNKIQSLSKRISSFPFISTLLENIAIIQLLVLHLHNNRFCYWDGNIFTFLNKSEKVKTVWKSWQRNWLSHYLTFTRGKVRYRSFPFRPACRAPIMFSYIRGLSLP